jgi:hypothetical protein
MGDAMHMKSLQPGYQSRMRMARKRYLRQLEHLAEVVRCNIGRKCLRSINVSPTTMRMDRIRDALVELDRTPQTGGER